MPKYNVFTGGEQLIENVTYDQVVRYVRALWCDVECMVELQTTYIAVHYTSPITNSHDQVTYNMECIK